MGQVCSSGVMPCTMPSRKAVASTAHSAKPTWGFHRSRPRRVAPGVVAAITRKGAPCKRTLSRRYFHRARCAP